MTDPLRTAEVLLDGLLAHDLTALRDCLHPRVHLRALRPGSVLARVGAGPVATDWVRLIAAGPEVRVLDRSAWRYAGRIGLDLRLVAGDEHDRRECEHRMYLDLQDGLVHGIDVLASGTHRADPPSPHDGAGR